MKKTIAVLLALAMLVPFTLYGCASAPAAASEIPTATPAATPAASSAAPSATVVPTPAPTPTPAAPVTIRVTLSEGELSKDQIAAFEALHPNIKVQLESLDATKLAAELATNDAPDLIRLSGAFELTQYVIKGVAMDITQRLETSPVIKMDDLLPVCNVYRYDGKTIGEGPYYGLPKDWSNDYAVFYDKKCFDAAGIAVPDQTKAMTWQDLIALAKKLTLKDGSTVKQYGLSATEWGKTEGNFNFMLQYVLSAGGKINSADNKTMDFNIPAVKDFLTLWIDAVKSNIGPNQLNNDQTSGGDLFLQGKSAMLIDGYWYGGVIRSNEVAKAHIDDFGMLPTPIAQGGTRQAATGGATGCIIYSGTKNPDAAWTFFEWYFGGKPADERAATGWGMPIFKSKLSELPQATNFDKQILAVLNDESNYQGFLPVNPYLSGGGWGIFDKYASQLYFGKISIDDAIAGMTKDANVAVAEAASAIQ